MKTARQRVILKRVKAALDDFGYYYTPNEIEEDLKFTDEEKEAIIALREMACSGVEGEAHEVSAIVEAAFDRHTHSIILKKPKDGKSWKIWK